MGRFCVDKLEVLMWLVFEEVASCCISSETVKRVGCKMSAGKSVQAVFFILLW